MMSFFVSVRWVTGRAWVLPLYLTINYSQPIKHIIYPSISLNQLQVGNGNKPCLYFILFIGKISSPWFTAVSHSNSQVKHSWCCVMAAFSLGHCYRFADFSLYFPQMGVSSTQGRTLRVMKRMGMSCSFLRTQKRSAVMKNFYVLLKVLMGRFVATVTDCVESKCDLCCWRHSSA